MPAMSGQPGLSPPRPLLTFPRELSGSWAGAESLRPGSWRKGVTEYMAPQNRVSRKEVEPRWDLGGPWIGGPRARVRSPWKVLPRVWGLRLGSSGG